MKKIVLYLAIFCIPLIGFSQTETSNNKTDDSWHFNVTPYLWMTNLNGSMTVLNQTAPVDVGFADDLFSNLKIAAMFQGEVKKNKMALC